MISKIPNKTHIRENGMYFGIVITQNLIRSREQPLDGKENLNLTNNNETIINWLRIGDSRKTYGYLMSNLTQFVKYVVHNSRLNIS